MVCQGKYCWQYKLSFLFYYSPKSPHTYSLMVFCAPAIQRTTWVVIYTVHVGNCWNTWVFFSDADNDIYKSCNKYYFAEWRNKLDRLNVLMYIFTANLLSMTKKKAFCHCQYWVSYFHYFVISTMKYFTTCSQNSDKEGKRSQTDDQNSYTMSNKQWISQSVATTHKNNLCLKSLSNSI